jgi:hypothetical protein
MKRFRRGNLTVIMRRRRGAVLFIYRSSGRMLTLAEESDVVQELEAHWEAIKALLDEGVKWARFDFAGMVADKDIWAVVDFDIYGLIASGVQVDIVGRRAVIDQQPVSEGRNWNAVIEEWHRLLVAVGITVITLLSIASLLNYKVHQITSDTVPRVQSPGPRVP